MVIIELVQAITCTFIHCYAPTTKKLKGQIGLGLFVCPSIYPSPNPPPPPAKKQKKKNKKKKVFLDLDSLYKKFTYYSHPPFIPPPPPRKKQYFQLRFRIHSKKFTNSSTLPSTPFPSIFYIRFGFGFFVQKSLTLAPPLPPPPRKKKKENVLGFFIFGFL